MHRRKSAAFFFSAAAAALICFLLSSCSDPGLSGNDNDHEGYQVTYDGNGHSSGGAPLDGNYYDTGMTVTVMGPGNLAKAGSTFTGWNTAPDGSGTPRAVDSTFSMGTEDVVLYARWTTNPTYRVIYEGNGNLSGSAPEDANRYEAGMTVTVLGEGTDLSRPGYTFTGWNTAYDGSGADRPIGSTFVMGVEDVVLYARWTANPTYSVTYDGNGNTDGFTPVDYNLYETGMTVMVMDPWPLAKAGSTFAYWNTAPDGSGTDYAPWSTFSMGEEDVTLYARWTVIPTFAVTYDGNGNTGGEVPVDANRYEYGTMATVLDPGNLVKSGTRFAGWNTLADGSGFDYPVGYSFSIGADLRLYAQWATIVTYTVTYDGNGNTSGSAPVDGNAYESGSSATVLGKGTMTNLNYLFAGWDTQADGSGYSYSEGASLHIYDENVTLYAMWAKNTYWVTFDSQGADVNASPANVSVTSPAMNISALPSVPTKSGFIFNGWYTEANGGGEAFTVDTTVDSNMTVYAHWVTSNASWAAGSLPSAFTIPSAAYGNGYYVAVAKGGGRDAAYSVDGVNWHAGTLPATSPPVNAWMSVAYGNGVFVAVSYNSSVAATSSTGSSWTARSIPSASWSSITFGNGVFVAVAHSSNTFARSTDGVTWTTGTLPVSARWVDLTYGNGLFVTVSENLQVAATSPDGVNWTSRALPDNAMTVACGDGIFIFTCSQRIYTSTDCITWTQRTNPGGESVKAMAHGDGFIAISSYSSSSILRSADGISWTADTLPVPANWCAIISDGDRFLVLADASRTTLISK